MAYLCCILSNGDNSCFQSLGFQQKKRNLFKFIAEWMSFRELAAVESSFKEKIADCSHKEMGTCSDCWAELYDGIPPKKLWTWAKKTQLQRAHLTAKTGGSVLAGENTGIKDGICKAQGLHVPQLFLYTAMGWKLDSKQNMTEGNSHISRWEDYYIDSSVSSSRRGPRGG